jgi:hypothetical protein
MNSTVKSYTGYEQMLNCAHVFGPIHSGRIPTATCVKCGVTYDALPHMSADLFQEQWDKITLVEGDTA